jgi:uncharacterized protein
MHYGRVTMKSFEVLLSLHHTKFISAIVSCVFLATILAPEPGRADVRAGVEAYKKGEYETALREFADLAESGDPRAQYNLAVMYLKGRGVEKNLARAFDLQQRAAKGGLAAAQHGLAIMYYRGEGAERDYKKAAEWFRRAADRGFPTSQLNLGVMYFSGQGVKRNDAEVVKWITMAAAKGLPEALFRLGRMYEEGAIFPQNTQDAIYWYGKSSERGHADGENQVKRLQALLAARRATKDVGEKDTAATEPDAKKADVPAMAVQNPIVPAAPEVSAAPVDASPEPKIVKSVPEMAPQPQAQLESKSESKPEIRVWRAQLASFRTRREAKRAWSKLKRAFSQEFRNLKSDIVRVDLGPKRGVYHRLRAAPLTSRDAAFAFCNKLKSKSAKQGCIPLSPNR